MYPAASSFSCTVCGIIDRCDGKFIRNESDPNIVNLLRTNATMQPEYLPLLVQSSEQSNGWNCYKKIQCE